MPILTCCAGVYRTLWLLAVLGRLPLLLEVVFAGAAVRRFEAQR